MILQEILDNIYNNDTDYYKRILKHFGRQAVIDNGQFSDMGPEELAKFIISNGNLFGKEKYENYEKRQFTAIVSAYNFPITVDYALKIISRSESKWAMESALESCLVFKVKLDGDEYVVVPAEYKFIMNSRLRSPRQFSLDNVISGQSKERLKEFIRDHKIESVITTNEVFLKAAVYKYVINDFRTILSKFPEDIVKLYEQIADLHFIVSVDEFLSMIGNNAGNKIPNHGGKIPKTGDGRLEENSIVTNLAKNFLLLRVRIHNTGFDRAYAIPDEIMIAMAWDKLLKIKPVEEVLIPEKEEDHSMVISVRNFLIASYYLELHNKRRTPDKLTSILSIDEGHLRFLDSFCRHSNYIFGSSSTYNLSRSALEAMEDVARIENDIQRYVSSALSNSFYGVDDEDRDVVRVEQEVYNILRATGNAYYISDILKHLKWNPDLIRNYMERFMNYLTEASYLKIEDDTKEARGRIFDYSDEKLLDSAIGNLARLGVVRIGHDQGSGLEFAMISPTRSEATHDKADKRKTRDRMAGKIQKPVVQSNFEVIVSPLEDFSLMKNMIYGCDLVSASTNIVFKISEKSLRFYANNFADLNGFLLLLSQNSAHKIPDNVARTVQDLAMHTGEVTVRKCAGILVFKDAALMKKAMSNRSLSRIKSFAISDTVIGIINDDDFLKIGRYLEDAGFLYKVDQHPHSDESENVTRRRRKRRRYYDDSDDSDEW